MIRPARPEDLPVLRDVEIAAGACFRQLDMAAVADDEPPTVAELADYVSEGRAWVVVDHADHPVAYLLVQILDGNAHIDHCPYTQITPADASASRCLTPQPPGRHSVGWRR